MKIITERSFVIHGMICGLLALARPAKFIACCIIAILCMLFTPGCANIIRVTVVAPLNPTSAAVKTPASSVLLSFSTPPQCTNNYLYHLSAAGVKSEKLQACADTFFDRLRKDFEDELTKDIRHAGFTISQIPGGADFSMNVVLKEIDFSTYTLTDGYGNVIEHGTGVSGVTYDISYVGSNGKAFGTTQLKKIPVGSYELQVAAMRLVEFTRKHLKDPPK